ncbi:unnamed protein product [Gordionus sp. m RMFG-2023]|uniref:signal peptide peptidase-like 3 n=1 Tax=Gordionus sp. m RMFG-2023 TaxID=3053472 RepID=UPI0030E0542E
MTNEWVNMGINGVSWLFDTSRFSTFFISTAIIVYACFRSLNNEKQEILLLPNDETAEDREKLIDPPSDLKGEAAVALDMKGHNEHYRENKLVDDKYENFQMLNSTQALLLPLGASVTLLLMFYFFDSMQVAMTISTACIACLAFAFLLLPCCKFFLNSVSVTLPLKKLPFKALDNFTVTHVMAFLISLFLVFMWIKTGHWLLMNALGLGLCVSFISYVKLPSLKVSILLLFGLLIYDIFWVFFSARLFKSNVMLHVATRSADNPAFLLFRNHHFEGSNSQHPSDANHNGMVPKLSLPVKLFFPSSKNSGHFSMLGLGDIVMPGLLLCFLLRFDSQKNDNLPLDHKPTRKKLSYFQCSMIGYFIGLMIATLSSEIFKAPQPALLYLVPFTIIPILIMAYFKGDLRRMWNEPFVSLK